MTLSTAACSTARSGSGLVCNGGWRLAEALEHGRRCGHDRGMGGCSTGSLGDILKRLLLAFLVAPVLPALVQAWITNLAGEYHNPLAFFIMVCGALYALQLIVGIPAYLFFRRAKQYRLWIYVLLGFCAATVPLLPWLLYRCPPSGCRPVEAIWYSSNVGLLGASAAAIFWLIARPDKVARPPIPPSN
jgi:hypothetical protein